MFKLNYNDLVRIIKAYGYEEFTAQVVADYLDECIDSELDLSYYLWNTLPYEVKIFKTREEAINHINEHLHGYTENCILWGGHFGVYLEEL